MTSIILADKLQKALGRVASPSVVKARGIKTVSASAVQIDSDHDVPEALTEEEIHEYIADYASAAKNAIAAGFE